MENYAPESLATFAPEARRTIERNIQILQELCEILARAKKIEGLKQVRLQRLNRRYANPDDAFVHEFVYDRKVRKRILLQLKEHRHFFINGFLELLSKANEYAWSLARKDGKFKEYDSNLTMILDIFDLLDFKATPPALMEMLLSYLDRLADYIGPERGEAHAAFATWCSRAPELPIDILREMYNISGNLRYNNIRDLFERSGLAFPNSNS